MTNVRKTWKTLSAVPDPFEAGVVYVTQELTGHEVTAENSHGTSFIRWIKLGSSTFSSDRAIQRIYEGLGEEPLTRVQRCRLHASGRLENTDVAPKDINDTHNVTINPTNIQELGKFFSREMNWNHVRWGMAPGDEIVLKGADGRVDTIFAPVEKPWLSDEVPMPPIQAVGILRQWMRTPDTTVAVLGPTTAADVRRRFKDFLGREKVLQETWVESFVWSGDFHPMSLTITGRDKNKIKLTFFGSNLPDTLRGYQFHHFLAESSVVQDGAPEEDGTGLSSLDNLRLAVRLGDGPVGVVVDQF